MAIVDPFMRRVHEVIPQSAELILMDATSNLDRNDTKLFHLICPSVIGGLPVAELLTTRQDTDTILFGLELLKSVLPAGAFYGRDINVGPKLFMIDALRNTLSELGHPLSSCFARFISYKLNGTTLANLFREVLRQISQDEGFGSVSSISMNV